MMTLITKYNKIMHENLTTVFIMINVQLTTTGNNNTDQTNNTPPNEPSSFFSYISKIFQSCRYQPQNNFDTLSDETEVDSLVDLDSTIVDLDEQEEKIENYQKEKSAIQESTLFVRCQKKVWSKRR
jgi:hypothetical protein